jgi:hypothetical protein
MDRRAFFQQTGLGLLAAAPTTTQGGGYGAGGETDIIRVTDFGAVGDGLSDDTLPLQNAINAAIQQGKPCFIPSGVFRVTRSLVIGGNDMTKTFQAFRLFGTGKAATRNAGKGGTNIYLDATGQLAVLQVSRSAWRRCEIRDIGLECPTLDAAQYGLLFDSTEFSNHLVDNVGVYRAGVGFGILQGTGANGEFIMFNNCGAFDVAKFFHTNAGQAYVQYFNHCECVLRAAGIYFHLDFGSGGGGLNVVDFNASTPALNGVSNTTLVKNGNSNSCLNFLGGRIEHLTQLYEFLEGTTNLHVTANFTGLQVTVDCDPVDANLSKPAFVNISMTPDILTVDSCSFEAMTGREAINVQVLNCSAYVLFKRCHFHAFPRPPYITAIQSDALGQVSFEDCKTTFPVPGTDSYRQVPLDRKHHHVVGAVGRRKAFSENGWVHSGRPTNLLLKPQFTDGNGAGIHADAPWAHYGKIHTFDAYDWNGVGPSAGNSSPWAKLVHIQPGSGLYQDISSIDFTSVKESYFINNVRFQAVAYQAMVTRINNGASLKFTLTDQPEKTIYDEILITGNFSDASYTRLVTLVGAIAQQKSPIVLRFKIENVSPAPVEIEFAWQLLANSYDPAFAASDAAPARFAEEWGLSAENARLWSRLALPHKTDNFGSAASNPLNDLGSDIYLSQTDERVTFYANGKWWKAPRTTYAAAAPSSGSWGLGDVVYNNAPASGGHVGWICTAAGSPGTWKTFGAISP